ncbi:di-heme-cytochrome C peroxidase [Ruegeria hyattellae]|uniref:di-heme-cytochrome C peroxidase n=1 Tax=Ruegeria hyattellae TaxID=3233337 RepID=UPI00355C0A95
MSRFGRSRFSWFLGVLLVLFVTVGIAVVVPKIRAFLALLTPPETRTVILSENRVSLQQNWDETGATKFHHTSQGTETLTIPLSWFLALEQPLDSPFALLNPFLETELLTDSQYLARYGFLPSEKSENNPHNLPIGFATSLYQKIDGLVRQDTAIGLTCAACHTGSITYDNVDYLVNGGPANVDLALFKTAMGVTLGQTVLASKLPVPNRRFDRFAKRVLGQNYTLAAKDRLASELQSVVEVNAARIDSFRVIEGYARLDALNRIGNQVFSIAFDQPENYVPISAPVNFPHIWTTSWFDWVEYDGSIMQPLIRNAGEALGVQAEVNFTAPLNKGRFTSSVPMENLAWMEDFLGGSAPYPKKAFGGLLAPKWPDAFPPIDQNLAAEGAKIYQARCKACHLPAVDTPEFWTGSHFKPIEYTDAKTGNTVATAESYLSVNIIPVDYMGTDPAQSRVLTDRIVNTSGDTDIVQDAMGLNTVVCIPKPGRTDAYSGQVGAPKDEDEQDTTSRTDNVNSSPFENVKIGDGPGLNFGLALGAVVQEVNDAWFASNFMGDQKLAIEGDRPNCLQTGKGYKARPLNGIWATAPFLHNGSVATLDDMFKPHSERLKVVELGRTDFDPVKVGLVQPTVVPETGQAYRDGLFYLDTTLPGNLNTGHEFSNEAGRGVIGPAFSDLERQQLIEYLKTL